MTDRQEVRARGNRLLMVLSDALRELAASRVHTRRAHAAVTKLAQAVAEAVDRDGSLELRVFGELLLVNGLRLRHTLDNYVAFGRVLGALQRCGVGVLLCDAAPDEGEWETFLKLLLNTGRDVEEPDAVSELRRRSQERLVRRIHVGGPAHGDAQLPDERQRREAARRTYAKSVAVTRELFDSARLGRAVNVKDVKHALHAIVDQVLDNEASLAGLSALRDYDDYAFTHAVNVSIFSVAIGKRLGLTKAQLYDLGMAALVHDLGMSRVPVQITSKAAALTPAERKAMEAHTWLGALSAFELGDFGRVPFRAMIAAYEHHMTVDGGGYPRAIRPRRPSVYSRIIAVADAFDAATNTRAHTQARPADEVLGELQEWTELGFDPVVVKALINVLGIYPVGTLVILDTMELGLVHGANPDPANLHRPLVRILSDPDGVWLDAPPVVDLAETGPEGERRRTIIKVTDPDRYGVTVSEYFV